MLLELVLCNADVTSGANGDKGLTDVAGRCMPVKGAKAPRQQDQLQLPSRHSRPEQKRRSIQSSTPSWRHSTMYCPG